MDLDATRTSSFSTSLLLLLKLEFRLNKFCKTRFASHGQMCKLAYMRAYMLAYNLAYVRVESFRGCLQPRDRLSQIQNREYKQIDKDL